MMSVEVFCGKLCSEKHRSAPVTWHFVLVWYCCSPATVGGIVNGILGTPRSTTLGWICCSLAQTRSDQCVTHGPPAFCCHHFHLPKVSWTHFICILCLCFKENLIVSGQIKQQHVKASPADWLTPQTFMWGRQLLVPSTVTNIMHTRCISNSVHLVQPAQNCCKTRLHYALS